MGAKSSAALSVSVAYCMFQASNAATVTPRTTFMLSMPCCMPMLRTTFLSSSPDAVCPPRATTIPAAASSATASPPMPFTRTLLKVSGLRSSTNRRRRQVDHWTISSSGIGRV